MPDPLTLQDVRHIAKLARLRLTDEQAARFQTELSAVLDYMTKLSELDVSGVKPMAHPTEQMNRLSEDEPGAVLPLDRVLLNAPAIEGEFFAVPKVLEEGDAA